MTTRADYVLAIDQFVQGEIPLVEADKILAVNMAVKEHSKVKPREVVEDISGTGSFDYAVSGLASWSDGFSVMKQVEYPVDDDDETPDVLEDGAWMVYTKPTGKFLRFLEDTPASGESARVTYAAVHTCDDSTDTVDVFDMEAVQALASAFFCDMLATYYAQNQDSVIDADSVDHTSKSKDYAARAAKNRKIYFDHMGLKEGKPKPACHVQDQDVVYPSGLDRLTHPRKRR